MPTTPPGVSKIIVRTVCLAVESLEEDALRRLNDIVERLERIGCQVQTRRILSPGPISRFGRLRTEHETYFSVGAIPVEALNSQWREFSAIENSSCHIDIASEVPESRHVDLFLRAMREQPRKTFYFSYSALTPAGSPFFPAATFAREGFSVGLQPTNLAEGCASQDEWHSRMRETWERILACFEADGDFLGIDSSVAPLGDGSGSLVGIVRRLFPSFSSSLLSEFYVNLTDFLATENPRPTGLCGLMLPCLEDFHLAEEYEQGNFTLVTNLYLSMHSGLGIDTFPVGLDEDPEALLNSLRLVRALALKHSKPLSVRFVSDGASKIGAVTDFKNQYLRDVRVRALAPRAGREVEGSVL